jgi:V/A-type H+/Na+-transporting ATPase subunit K
MRPAKPFMLAAVSLGALLAVGATLLLAVPLAFAAEAAPAVLDPSVARWAFAAAAGASAVAAAAAGYAVAQVGSAAVGAVTEKPELFGRMLILVGLAEGIAIYGLIVAVLIFNRVS